jgi:hypothetical protein
MLAAAREHRPGKAADDRLIVEAIVKTPPRARPASAGGQAGQQGHRDESTATGAERDGSGDPPENACMLEHSRSRSSKSNAAAGYRFRLLISLPE